MFDNWNHLYIQYLISSGAVLLVLIYIFKCYRLWNIRKIIYKAHDGITKLTGGNSYFRFSQFEDWKGLYVNSINKIPNHLNIFPISKKYRKNLFELVDWKKSGNTKRDTYNKQFIDNEIKANKNFFDAIESYALSETQREAIVADEDHNLVIAGAGTGKTTTIVGKFSYLVRCRKIKPNEILLLAFTNNAASEMQERIKNKSGYDFDVKTFHKFGLDIIAGIKDDKPKIAFGDDNRGLLMFIKKEFYNLLKESDYSNNLADFSLFYLSPVRSQFSYSTKREAEFQDAEELYTLKGEKVKSHEERFIADYLFKNQINYEYERKYEQKTSNRYYSQYLPDFYLPDYRIYIEHYGIDRYGNVPKFFSGRGKLSAKEEYHERMKWHKKIHKKYGTTLIETYSYEKMEGILLSNLGNRLKEHGVIMNPLSPDALLKMIKEKKGEFVGPIIQLIAGFLHLYKNNPRTPEEMIKRADNKEAGERVRSFLDLFFPLLDVYNNHLKENNLIDFGDMISNAREYIENGKYINSYKYVLVDEFQDVSWSRYKLLKSLLASKKQSSLFCVGDDWQSIYRFTGSELSIVVDFEKYFGVTKLTKLDTTYRFNNKISELTESFILKNPRQIKKKLSTLTKVEHEVLFSSVRGRNDQSNELNRILNIINELPKPDGTISVFILARYNFNKPEDLPHIIKKYPKLDINWMTVHKAKGLEADFIIIDSLNSGKYGFPTEIVDDPLLDVLLQQPDKYPNAEERRLMYVALSRARKGIYIVGDFSSPSEFLVEIGDPSQLPLRCPVCKIGFLKLEKVENTRFRSKYSRKRIYNRQFYWREYCSKSPICNYSEVARDAIFEFYSKKRDVASKYQNDQN